MDAFIRSKPYTGGVQAVVLDWAGTAVDYGCIGPVAVFIEVFKRQGVEVTAHEARKPMGLMKKDHVRAMCHDPDVAARWLQVHGRQPNESDVDLMYQETEPLMVDCIKDHSDPIPGAIETVQKLREMGLKVGASTGYTTSMMEILVPEAKAKGYSPDAVYCSTDAPAGRPYPWMCYLNAIELQVYPMEAMVKAGDTISDIQEGQNAGMWTVGFTRSGNELGLTKAEADALDPAELQQRLQEIETRFRQAGAHYVVEDITGLPAVVDEISARLNRGEQPLVC